MRTEALASLKSGITRLRDKGGASSGSLYDLVNGYVDASGAPTSRDGTTVDHTLPPGTIGLCAFQNKFHVFASVPIDPGSGDYVVDILVHPDPHFTGALKAIHFAEPFLGFLYVAAEFSDSQTFHFWLEDAPAWKAKTVYMSGDKVRPSAPNGFVYTPTTTADPPTWSPETTYQLGDVVQPTEYNGYQYTLVEVDGVNPASGASEPDWIAAEGALVTEDVDNTPTTTTTNPTTPGSTIPDRYQNLPGCVTLDSWVICNGEPTQAADVLVGDQLLLIDPETLEEAWGEVELAHAELQPCVRITFQNGVSLECSTTAPIATVDGEWVLAPQLEGQLVNTRLQGEIEPSECVRIEPLGVQYVLVANVGDRAFLAGATPDGLVPHHNAKRTDSEL